MQIILKLFLNQLRRNTQVTLFILSYFLHITSNLICNIMLNWLIHLSTLKAEHYFLGFDIMRCAPEDSEMLKITFTTVDYTNYFFFFFYVGAHSSKQECYLSQKIAIWLLLEILIFGNPQKLGLEIYLFIFLALHDCMLSPFSHVWLCGTLWTIARKAPLSVGFSRQEYWSGLPFPPPKDLPNPGTKPVTLPPYPKLYHYRHLGIPMEVQLIYKKIHIYYMHID